MRISLEGLLGFQEGRNIKSLVRVRTKFHFQSYDFCCGISLLFYKYFLSKNRSIDEKFCSLLPL